MRFFFFYLLLIGTPALAQLNADFTASTNQGCAALTVQFRDNSTGDPTSWFWDFGNGQTSSSTNPSITYINGGTYTVRLTIRNSSGANYIEKKGFITVFSVPFPDFSVTGPVSGCIPLTTTFEDNSFAAGTNVISRTWDFGNGQTSSVANPEITYNDEGIYDVFLTLTTAEGCTVSTRNTTIRAGTKPVVDFEAAPLDGCASEFRKFTDKTEPRGTSFLWSFGDNTKSNQQNPLHHYEDTGLLSVTLMVSNSGCTDSITKIDYIHIIAPAAKIGRSYNCSDQFTFSYRDLSSGVISRLWEFGDGQTSTDKAVSHTYAAPGLYKVKLTITGTTCIDSVSDTLHIKTGNPVISISSPKDIYCRNDSLLLSMSGYDSAIARTFTWDYGDGSKVPPFDRRFSQIYRLYRKNGTFKLTGFIRNIYGCIDTVPYDKPVPITGPYAAFESLQTGCVDTSVVFTDRSTIGGDDKAITQWLWSFGDGGTSTSNGQVEYNYIFPGLYNANLTVTDIDGCVDTITNHISIATVPVVDAGLDTFLCAGQTAILNATGADDYIWQNDADLNCLNCASPQAVPNQNKTYYVTGTTSGCSSSDSINIKVQQKQFLKVESDKYAICAGGNSVMLNASGTDFFTWSPGGTLSSTIVANPVAFPSANTNYTVVGRDSFSCFTDQATVSVIVNEKPTVSVGNSTVQLLIGSSYTIPGVVSNDVVTYNWMPLSGLSCTNCLQPVITVNENKQYSLIGINEDGCADTASVSIIAACTSDAIFVPNTFSPNNDGMNDYFFPRSPSGITIKSLSIFNRWGQLLFQKKNFPTNNLSSGWDGKYKNQPQSADVYTYFMEINCTGNKVFIKKGNVTLLR